jgi:hypothetical protein
VVGAMAIIDQTTKIIWVAPNFSLGIFFRKIKSITVVIQKIWSLIVAIESW